MPFTSTFIEVGDLWMPGIRALLKERHKDLDVGVVTDYADTGVIFVFSNGATRASIHVGDDVIAADLGPKKILDGVRTKLDKFLRPAHRKFEWGHKPEWMRRREILFRKFQ